MKKLLLKFSQYPQETPALESLFRPATLLKRDPNTGVFQYLDSCPLRKIAPWLRLGVWVKVRVSFRVGGQPHNCPQGKLVSG